MGSMNGTNSGEHGQEQGSSTKQVMKEYGNNASESKTEICSVKARSVQSKGKQLASDKPAKSKRRQRRTKMNAVYSSVLAKFSVILRAPQVLYSLKIEFPYFIKCMLPSNVSCSYWMRMQPGFCKLFLPNCDSPVTLVDESGKECKTTYLVARRGLSAGWRGFAISHKLREGDTLIFQLIDQCKFKVHIFRVYEPVSELVYEPVYKPVYEPVSEPVYQPVYEPVYQPVYEPVYQPEDVVAANTLLAMVSDSRTTYPGF